MRDCPHPDPAFARAGIRSGLSNGGPTVDEDKRQIYRPAAARSIIFATASG